MKDYNEQLYQKLNGKRILFIGVKFYYFNEDIITKMKQFGADVTFFYERDTSIKYSIAKALSAKKEDKVQDDHYNSILEKVEGSAFDYLLVIRGYKMKPAFVDKIRSAFPGIKTIMYQWDAYENWECDYRYLIPYFDQTLTFDRKDSETLGLTYVPTFHTDDFKNLDGEEKIYDLFFFGGYSYPRYVFMKKLIDYAKSNNYKLKYHLAISYVHFLREQLAGKKLDSAILSFHKLSKEDYIKLFNKSLVIVDYANASQSGITMRTLDALGGGKKVLTSNTYIQSEPEYDKEQINIFDPHQIKIDPDFMNAKEFSKKDYSIERWLDSIF